MLIVDDGVATGSTARAVCRIARARGAARIVLAVPVAPHDWTERLGEDADELICLHSPRNFFAIGQFYKIDFSQIDDDEVVACLEEAVARPVKHPPD
ncbi:phosphoribosyltransferase family protein [Streptomyces sp. NBC_01549]|uniref:phosphoribosyltransferase family protein n=1 Tax=Streptomyces sp. NBC_01549 TaxID=2975874 RepID=UPI002B1CBF82|nr:phosphoribosyltransferase family protein [Streptomyces sp. NBC_01549]